MRYYIKSNAGVTCGYYYTRRSAERAAARSNKVAADQGWHVLPVEDDDDVFSGHNECPYSEAEIARSQAMIASILGPDEVAKLEAESLPIKGDK